jgi:hypothetical protein
VGEGRGRFAILGPFGVELRAGDLGLSVHDHGWIVQNLPCSNWPLLDDMMLFGVLFEESSHEFGGFRELN